MAVTEYTWNPLTDSVIEETDGAGNVLVEYTSEPAPYGPLISERRGTESRQYHFDALGSTRALTDDGQTVTDTFAYDAWGEVKQGQMASGRQLWIGRHGYSADASNRFYVRERYYASSLARWQSVDKLFPAAVDRLYLYASNGPARYIDPSGLVATNTYWFDYLDHFIPERDLRTRRVVWARCALQVRFPTAGESCSAPWHFTLYCRSMRVENTLEYALARLFHVDVVGNSAGQWEYIQRGIASHAEEVTMPAVAMNTWWFFTLAGKCADPCSPHLECTEKLEMYFLGDESFRIVPLPNTCFLRLRLTAEYTTDSTSIIAAGTSAFSKRQAHGIFVRHSPRVPESWPAMQTDVRSPETSSLCLR